MEEHDRLRGRKKASKQGRLSMSCLLRFFLVSLCLGRQRFSFLWVGYKEGIHHMRIL